MLTLEKFVEMRIKVYEILNGRESMTLMEIAVTMGITTEEELRNLEQILDGLAVEQSNNIYKYWNPKNEIYYCVI